MDYYRKKAYPFVKWVGGKRGIVKTLIKYMPKEYSWYCEPFIGGGALFFEVEPEFSKISDINEKLIITYIAVRDHVEDLIAMLRIHKQLHSADYYYEARNSFNDQNLCDNVYIASLFIYLNKTCFNGLYRVNNKGLYNVPLGSYKTPIILEEDNLRACSELLQNVDIVHGDFSDMIPHKGQFFYLDPPYHNTGTQYSSCQFSENDQRRLMEFCKNVDSVGGYFMVSNADTPFIRELFDWCYIDIVQAPRYVACKGSSRKRVQELIIRNYE